MNRLLKPASLLLYLLAILNFFMVGVHFAKITGATDEQGLAAGAIILGYGVLFAFVALLISTFLVYNLSHPTIVFANRLLLIIFIIFAIILTYQVKHRTEKQIPIEESPIKPPSPTEIS